MRRVEPEGAEQVLSLLDPARCADVEAGAAQARREGEDVGVHWARAFVRVSLRVARRGVVEKVKNNVLRLVAEASYGLRRRGRAAHD